MPLELSRRSLAASAFRSAIARSALALSAMFLLAGNSAARSATATRPRAEPKLSGHLTKLQGNVVLHLHGSDRERGFTEGYLRAAALQELLDGWALKIMPAAAWNYLARPMLLRRFTFPEWAIERAEGAIAGMRAKGARFLRSDRLGRDLESEDILAVAALIDAPGMLCSSLAMWGDDVAGGGPIVARNLDYASTNALLRNVVVVVEAPREGRRGTISIGFTSIGVTTGLNDAGVFVAIHDVPSKVENDTGHTPRIFALQELLWKLEAGEKCAARARKLLLAKRFAYGGNAMLSWGSAEHRGARVIELGPAPAGQASVQLRQPRDASWIACTNHFRDRRGPRRCRRYKSITRGAVAATEEEGKAGPDELWSILGTARVPGTLHTVLFDAGTGKLRVAFRLRRHAEEWRELQCTVSSLLEAGRKPEPPQATGK